MAEEFNPDEYAMEYLSRQKDPKTRHTASTWNMVHRLERHLGEKETRACLKRASLVLKLIGE